MNGAILDSLNVFSAGGDINGDGIDDFLISSPGSSTNGLSRNGVVMIAYGSVTFWNSNSTITVDHTNITLGTYVEGAATQENLRIVTNPGMYDMDLDGTKDLLTYSSNILDHPFAIGATTLFYGPLTSPRNTSAPYSERTTIFGESSGQEFGRYKGIIPDITGDGYPDYLLASWTSGSAQNSTLNILPGSGKCSPCHYLVGLLCVPCAATIANSSGSWNPPASNPLVCTFVPVICTSGEYVNIQTNVSICTQCPGLPSSLGKMIGSINDNGNSLDCVHEFGSSLCEAGEFAAEYVSPEYPFNSISYCTACFSKFDNPEPNIETTCTAGCTVFDANGKAQPCKKGNDEIIYQLSLAFFGFAGVSAISVLSCCILSRRNKRRMKVVYREIDTVSTGMTVVGKGKTRYNVNILTLDGGGIRGLISATLLNEFEKFIGAPVSKLFHLICGTSTGGIIALGIHAGMSQEKIINLYQQLGSEVFSSDGGKLRKFVRQLNGSSIYSGQKLENLLKFYLEDKMMIEGPPSFPKIVTVATLSSANPPCEYLLRTFEVDSKFRGNRENDNWQVWEAARSTSAAPMYFTEFRRGELFLSDGALFHNNPARIGLVEARNLWENCAISTFLSIGTGTFEENSDSETSQKLSYIRWISTLGKIMINTERVHNEMKESLPNESYFRIQPVLPFRIGLDTVSDNFLQLMEMTAKSTFWDEQDKIQRICHRLGSQFDVLSPSLQSTSIKKRFSVDMLKIDENKLASLGAEDLLNIASQVRRKVTIARRRLDSQTPTPSQSNLLSDDVELDVL